MRYRVPQFIVVKRTDPMEHFSHHRADGRRLIFGFSSWEEGDHFIDANELGRDWVAIPFDPENLKAFLSVSRPQGDDWLTLDATSPNDSILATELRRVITALQSANPEDIVELAFECYPADAVAHSR